MYIYIYVHIFTHIYIYIYIHILSCSLAPHLFSGVPKQITHSFESLMRICNQEIVFPGNHGKMQCCNGGCHLPD